VRNVSPMPKSLSFAQAAAVPVAALTAFQALFHAEKGGMIPGQKVLIHGAAGWCWQLRCAICEERRVTGGSDLRR
jgi:NADPH:quinone reductase-like Zn-dependent oxidoreductase